MIGTVRRLAFAVALLARVAHGAAADVPFQRDPVEHYGSRILSAMLVGTILLVLFSLLRYRGRLESPTSWGLLMAGVVLMPPACIAFGTLLALQRAEQVTFCGSCHLAMQAYVDDLQNPNSHSLAAIHYKNRYIPANQCYSCHTSFGLFGTVHAKIAGMVDVHKYYTRTFRLPIKLREPYKNTDCLKCHAGAIRWSKSHEGYKDQVFSDEIRCLECHGKSNPAHVLASRAAGGEGR